MGNLAEIWVSDVNASGPSPRGGRHRSHPSHLRGRRSCRRWLRRGGCRGPGRRQFPSVQNADGRRRWQARRCDHSCNPTSVDEKAGGCRRRQKSRNGKHCRCRTPHRVRVRRDQSAGPAVCMWWCWATPYAQSLSDLPTNRSTVCTMSRVATPNAQERGRSEDRPLSSLVDLAASCSRSCPHR